MVKWGDDPIQTETQFYQLYLEEMHQLEKFRHSNSALFGETPLETEDPYTKRLIESLAFFSARARLQGTRKIVELHQCLFRQYFPYLVNSLPTFGMLQIKPTIRYPEKVTFPAGSEVVFKTANGLKATFQTLESTTVHPLFPKKWEFYRRGDLGWRFLIEFSTPHIITEEIKALRFYINHLNSFTSSLTVLFAMQYSLEKIDVFYDCNGNFENGKECAITFGHREERKVYKHIVEQLRSLLHCPQQELFINLEIPPAGKRWQTLTFAFDFDNKWPESVKLTHDSFVPFVAPMINLKLCYADPITVDGTQDSYPILYPEPTHHFELHSVVNVQEVLSSGMSSIKPGFLALSGSGSYEVNYFSNRIMFYLSDAFQQPKTMSVLALWSQPWFSNYINDELDLQFIEAETFGLEVKLLGSFHRSEQTLADDPNFLIRLLSLKNQNYLSLNEIFFIINTMKNLKNSLFDSVADYIKELKINKKFNHKQISSVIEYEFFLKELAGQKTELFILFFKYLSELLNCWLANYELEIKVHFPRHKKPLIIKQGKQYELSTLARDMFLS